MAREVLRPLAGTLMYPSTYLGTVNGIYRCLGSPHQNVTSTTPYPLPKVHTRLTLTIISWACIPRYTSVQILLPTHLPFQIRSLFYLQIVPQNEQQNLQRHSSRGNRHEWIEGASRQALGPFVCIATTYSCPRVAEYTPPELVDSKFDFYPPALHQAMGSGQRSAVQIRFVPTTYAPSAFPHLGLPPFKPIFWNQTEN